MTRENSMHISKKLLHVSLIVIITAFLAITTTSCTIKNFGQFEPETKYFIDDTNASHFNDSDYKNWYILTKYEKRAIIQGMMLGMVLGYQSSVKKTIRFRIHPYKVVGFINEEFKNNKELNLGQMFKNAVTALVKKIIKEHNDTKQKYQRQYKQKRDEKRFRDIYS